MNTTSKLLDSEKCQIDSLNPPDVVPRGPFFADFERLELIGPLARFLHID